MNWYKIAKELTLQISSYVPEYEQLKVLMNGVSYTFYNVSPFWKNKIEYLIEKSNMPHSFIYQKYLKNFSDPKTHKELNPPVEKPTEAPVNKIKQPTFWDK